MKVNVKVKLNPDFKNEMDTISVTALDKTAEAVLSDMKARGVIPKDTGELERSGFVAESKEFTRSIIFNTPYARRWYFNPEGVQFRKTKNPNAQDHWMDYYLDGEGLEFVIETYKKFLKECSGGLIK